MSDTDIDVAIPEVNLRITGVVQRMRGWLYEYGDVLDGSGRSSLATLLLAYFEDQKVEMTVRVLED